MAVNKRPQKEMFSGLFVNIVILHRFSKIEPFKLATCNQLSSANLLITTLFTDRSRL
jgi:hypothetical protein